jgi:hypothetical protein
MPEMALSSKCQVSYIHPSRQITCPYHATLAFLPPGLSTFTKYKTVDLE